MKASELRIGNWVHDLSNNVDFQIECFLGSEWCEGIYEYDREEFDSKIEDLKPILLTEEWLLKFGFNKILGKFVINPNSRYNVCVALRDNKWHLYNDDCDAECNIICEVETVHRLQNLFFDIWNLELTIKN